MIKPITTKTVNNNVIKKQKVWK